MNVNLIRGFNKNPIFKGKLWKWKKYFYTNNLLVTILQYLRGTGCCPFNYTNILPKRLIFLAKPLHWIFVVAIISIAMHMNALFIYTLFLKAINSDYTHLSELSDLLIMAIVYSFTAAVVGWCNFNAQLLSQIIQLINQKFKMRSAVGKLLLTCF